MAIPFPKFPENSLNFRKLKRNNPKNQNLKKIKEPNYPNLKSIWAILSSLCMYISIFYIFNLSPSALISTTKFWFFISNTLLLILTADFAAFSSTKKLDFYTIKHTHATSVSTREEHVNDSTSSEGYVIVSKEMMMTWHYVREEETNPRDSIMNAVEVGHEKKKEKRAKCVRSSSESAAVAAAAEEERAVVLRRTSSERHDDDYCGKQRLEDDYFSRMSNEELNTRFEEFIRRFNTQIRLQALRNR